MQINRNLALVPQNQELSDEELVRRILAGETALYEILMRRNNQRIYRVARAILRNDTEAEDVMQDAYVRAYGSLGQYAGEARFSTWLTRIAVHECLARLRKQKRFTTMEEIENHEVTPKVLRTSLKNPEEQILSSELRSVLEMEIDQLPRIYRAVFIVREVEEMSTIESAIALGITEKAVKTRLHRAKAILRKRLYRRLGTAAGQIYPFGAEHCDRVVEAVLARLEGI